MPIREVRRTISPQGYVELDINIIVDNNEDIEQLMTDIRSHLNTSRELGPQQYTIRDEAPANLTGVTDTVNLAVGDTLTASVLAGGRITTSAGTATAIGTCITPVDLTGSIMTVDTINALDYTFHLDEHGTGLEIEPVIPVHPDCVLCNKKLSHPEWLNNLSKERIEDLKKIYDGRRPVRMMCCDCMDKTNGTTATTLGDLAGPMAWGSTDAGITRLSMGAERI